MFNLVLLFVFFCGINASVLSLLDKGKEEECGFLTTNFGQKINDNQNSLKAGERGPTLIEDMILREKITHFDHERIPERVVHARGNGAHGYFQVYKSLSHLSKAAFLQDTSIKTPVFVRFSTVAGPRGSADTVRDVRGFATRFYTTEGNFDLVGNNIPVFFIQDSIKFPDLIHSVKQEPRSDIPTAASAHDNFWDFISLTPESMHMIMWHLSDRAIPRSLATMEGFGVHTFRLVNEAGKSHFVKFHWKPLNGIYSLVFDEAQIIAGKDPDFHRRDLWDLIENKQYPEWELGIQVLAENELKKVEFDILDPTKIWPEEDVPVMKIGKMTLNRNPDNFFNEVEQVAFHLGNIVSGIDYTNDPLLQGRLFSYLDTQLLRLGGPNFHEIPINQPIVPVRNTQRDGFKRQTIDIGNVNYEPNSLGKGCPMQAAIREGGFVSFPEIQSGEKIRKRSDSFSDHYTQATLFWNSMSEHERRHIVMAFQVELGKVQHSHIQEKMVDHLNHINHTLAVAVANTLGLTPPKTDESKKYKKSSPALSQENHQVTGRKGRKVALLGAEGNCVSEMKDLQNVLNTAGVTPLVISKHLGTLEGELEVDLNYRGSVSVLFDGVIVGGIHESTKNDAIHFIQEAYRHLKPIGAFGEGVKLLEAAGIKATKPAGSSKTSTTAGVVVAGSAVNVAAFWTEFQLALEKYRFWEREEPIGWGF